MMHRTATAAAILALTTLAACSGMKPMASMPMMTYSQAALPAAVQVPAGNRVALETVGVGMITYECRAKTGAAGHEWVFVGPDAKLNSRMGTQVGKYYGPPATWESMDGPKLTAVQVAVAPAGAGAIPLQLVKGNPAMGMGAMQGVTYIQRVSTVGGVAPSAACGMGNMGNKVVVPYQADYIFYKAA